MVSQYKYSVVGGKSRASNKVLSNHNRMKYARASARKYSRKGYYGFIRDNTRRTHKYLLAFSPSKE